MSGIPGGGGGAGVLAARSRLQRGALGQTLRGQEAEFERAVRSRFSAQMLQAFDCWLGYRLKVQALQSLLGKIGQHRAPASDFVTVKP